MSQALADKKLEQDIELYSFDIFDTLVTRRVAEPVGIFALVQEQLQDLNIPLIVKNNFTDIRKGCEDYVRHNYGFVKHYWEISFNDIYTVMGENYGLTIEQLEIIKNIEIQTEIKNLVPLTQNLERLKALLNLNKKVVLISDMYYNAETLTYILSQIDKVFENIKIYVSYDYKKGKCEGDLYEIVRQNEQVKFTKWEHIGDNDFADIRQAKLKKINTQYYKKEDLMPYEYYLLEKTGNISMSQINIGAARLARIFAPSNIKNKEIYDFGCSFAAPILYGFVDWLLDNALEKNFKTLYFIARDGYIPKLIADRIIELKKLPIKTKYLYGSRLAWRIPSNQDFDKYVDALFEEYNNRLSIDFLSYRLGIDSKTLQKILDVKTSKQIFNKKQREYLKNKIKNNPAIKDKILTILEEKRELLKDYLKQEIDFSESNLAFVDLQGTGRTQDAIAKVLNDITPCNITTMYFSSDYPKVQSKNSKKIAFYAGEIELICFIELLGRTPDGQTIGYYRDNNKVIPITEKGYTKQINNWGIQDYIKGINTFVDFLSENLVKNNLSYNFGFKIYLTNRDFIINHLDKNTSRILGDIPWTAIGDESKKLTTAPELTFTKALLCFIFNKKIHTDFPQIVTARSKKFNIKIYKLQNKYGSLRKFLINLYICRSNKTAYIRLLGIKISLSRLLWGK